MSIQNYITNSISNDQNLNQVLNHEANLKCVADYLHFFHEDCTKSEAHNKNLLGGKGLGLIEMSRFGIPVPVGFIIDTSISVRYGNKIATIYENENTTHSSDDILPKNFRKSVNDALKQVEFLTGKNFDGDSNLLLLSVRSGAPVSMPGMMDTILNIGLTQNNLSVMIKDFGERFSCNSYLRLLECYINTVLSLDYKNLSFRGFYLVEYFDRVLRSNYRDSVEITELREFIDFICGFIEKNNFGEILRNAEYQLYLAVLAVLRSYNGERAKIYRELNGIDNNMGTAVIVQSMVFGNMNDKSCTGVLFSRDTSTGENTIFGEYIINAQGEDVVSGICTPDLINDDSQNSMKNVFPECYKELIKITKMLEVTKKDVQDIEFTVENNKLYILQSRAAKRSVEADLKFAIDFFEEGILTEKDALLRINPLSIDKMLHPVFKPSKDSKSITKGLPASPGAAVGKVVFNSQSAAEIARSTQVILVRMDTSPEDIMGMTLSQGILTARGGMTSHAAVVARGMGKPCVCGAIKLSVHENRGYCEILQPDGAKIRINEMDTISINGSTGEIFIGAVELRVPDFSQNFNTVMSWADKYRRLGVMVNADTEADCIIAKKFGAEGIGLCRTEHMFFDEERILYVRQMILAEKKEDRARALIKIREFQKEDFVKLFRIMDGLPVTIRLLDPPLHEFLPATREAVEKFAQFSNINIEAVNEKIESLTEKNPMLGHRGCRLGISYPEIYDCQVEAIFEAIEFLEKEEPKIIIKPEIMVPLVAWVKEAKILIARIHDIACKIGDNRGKKFNYLVGSMIELPRAALAANEIAEDVDFFSFGTNDLTQTTLGISRDDMIYFLNDYIENGILNKNEDPFVDIDPYVGELIEIACKRGRSVKSNLKIGICGEHGGSPKSIELFDKLGINYVSTSPYRVPVARLAAGQAGARNSTD